MTKKKYYKPQNKLSEISQNNLEILVKAIEYKRKEGGVL